MITSNSAQITTGETSKGERTVVNLSQVLSGFAFEMDLWGVLLVCKKDNHTYLVGIPSERWQADVEDDGYTVIGKITQDGYTPIPQTVTGAAENPLLVNTTGTRNTSGSRPI